MDIWRIFENFGFAILLHKLPTFHSFLTFLTPTCFGKSSRVSSVLKIFEKIKIPTKRLHVLVIPLNSACTVAQGWQL